VALSRELYWLDAFALCVPPRHVDAGYAH
jgi:hypothetical protein